MYGYLSNELYHHGVKGMKWGVRNYQNPDGSLTAEGRRRYGFDENSSFKNTKIDLSKHYKYLTKTRTKDFYNDMKMVKKETKGLKNVIREQKNIRENYQKSAESIDKALRQKYGDEAVTKYYNKDLAKKMVGAAVSASAALTLATVAGAIASFKK